jgi:hypothetical protein
MTERLPLTRAAGAGEAGTELGHEVLASQCSSVDTLGGAPVVRACKLATPEVVP